uniref:Uncharacterized protein n=1 Tax=Populus trichocarpa TaxID=3694 RepID=A0A2K1ZID2_POPTR
MHGEAETIAVIIDSAAEAANELQKLSLIIGLKKVVLGHPLHIPTKPTTMTIAITRPAITRTHQGG